MAEKQVQSKIQTWWNEVKGVKNFKGIKFSLAILF